MAELIVYNVPRLKFEALPKFQITNRLAWLLILGYVRHIYFYMKEIKRKKTILRLPSIKGMGHNKEAETIEQLWEKTIRSISPVSLSDTFMSCTCLTEIPKGLFNGMPQITNFSTIPNHWKDQKIDYNYGDWLRVEKHRCPNCGATKLIQNDCEYCGT